MADYPKMYTTLFQAVTRAITILQEAQQETEEIYISSPETVISITGELYIDENEDDKNIDDHQE